MVALIIVLLCALILMVTVILVSRLYALDVVKYTFGRLSSLTCERSCSKAIRKTLPNASHYHNVIVGNYEIDMVSVTEYGLLVFEFKSLQGSIKGTSNSKYWTRSWKSGVSYSFRNPIIQNEAHILALRSCLPDYNGSYVNIIIFDEQSLLTDIRVEDGRAIILHSRWIKRGIFSRLSKSLINNREYIDRILTLMEGEYNDV